MSGANHASRRVLLTGASGLIGAEVATRLISDGADVLGVDLAERPATLTDLAGYRHDQTDVRDDARVRELMQEFDPTDVVHLAARHMIPECESDPGACWEVNVSATVALVKLSVESGVQRFGLASSADVYAQGPEAKTIRSPLSPVSVYGRSKRSAEEVVEAVARNTRTVGIVFRPFNIYGPRDVNSHLIPTLIDQALNGGRVAVGDLTTTRDYVYVTDAARAVVTVMASPSSTTINIGTGSGHTGIEVVDAIREAVGREFELWIDPQRERSVDRARLVSRGAMPGRGAIPLHRGVQMTVQQRTPQGEVVPA